jgi:S-adenosylmethionine:tRNA ribosyltransferase-isomerase
MTEFEQLLTSYGYPLEKEWIAERPASPRDSAKLLVYDRASGKNTYDTFAHLAEYLPKDTLLVFNDTKVMPARLITHKNTGGKVEVLCTQVSTDGHSINGLANKRLQVGDMLSIDTQEVLRVTEMQEKEYVFEVVWTEKNATSLLATHGTTPIPPYLKHTPLSESELRKEYQTIFADVEGSSAAPTASLHFTQNLLKSLEKSGIKSTFVTLHVGLGTFAPLTEGHVQSGQLHSEYYELGDTTLADIAQARVEGRPIIPVGTTALRALESAYAQESEVRARGETQIFIREGYDFKIASGLITNFHVPRSSLMMLVAALVGREQLLALYADARTHDLKFLSFGDGMLIR